MEARHDSVLTKEVLEVFDIKQNDVVVDATLGGAGHFSLFLSILESGGTIVGIDADKEAVERAKLVYKLDKRENKPASYFVTDNFRNLNKVFKKLNLKHADKVFFDLGWSGYQIASSRGFSFVVDGGQNTQPLMMNYGLKVEGYGYETAAEIINSSSEKDIAEIIFKYGEEKFARSIAKAIVEIRSKKRILTTDVLVEAIKLGTPEWYHKRKTHPATKTFQALRIAVNDEIQALSDGLSNSLEILANNGVLGVITFHSIEDRVVKNFMREMQKNGKGKIITKKVIVPSRSEILKNRRARSAKLRVFKKTFSYA